MPTRWLTVGVPVLLAAVLAALARPAASAGEAVPAAAPAAAAPAPGIYPAAPDEQTAFAILAANPIPDGRAYAPFYNYVIGPHAVLARGAVYCVFQNSRGRPMAMTYRPDAKTWAGPVRVADVGLERDDHGNPALVIDAKGLLHVFYGCHGGAMRHAVSEKPYDIAAWREGPSPAPRATYPQVMRAADGRLLLFYRAGGHPEPWCLQTSADDGRTWSAAEKIIEMRKAPPDPLACAYVFFLPGADGRSLHCFWNHKDDNAARVTAARPHPWRPLKYPGLHEAVYRYNVYYLRRDAEGAWRNAAGRAAALPVSKAEADARCLIYDSGDEFTMLGLSLAVDAADRPYIRFGTGVVDWVREHKDPKAVIVPAVDRYAAPDAAGAWQVVREPPAAWPADILRALGAPGAPAFGDEWPDARWFISARRRPSRADLGCAVFLYHEGGGYVPRDGGPASAG